MQFISSTVVLKETGRCRRAHGW